jgi:hypothetical protein
VDPRPSDVLCDQEPRHVASTRARLPGATVGRANLPAADARRCPAHCRNAAGADSSANAPVELPTLQRIKAVDLQSHDAPPGAGEVLASSTTDCPGLALAVREPEIFITVDVISRTSRDRP